MSARGRIEVTIRRPDGKMEIIDGTKMFSGFMNQAKFDICRKQTKNAKRGHVVKSIVTVKNSNIADLIKRYNNLNNEGGDGYIPEHNYFKNMTEYKEFENTVEFN